MISVLIAGDDERVRAELRAIIGTKEDIKVCGEVSDRLLAISAVSEVVARR